MILLSYIIPLYNSAKWLGKCLDSVLNQDIDESEVEVVCVNDGSPDNSAEIARGYQREHPCVVVIDQQNQGPSGARNTGMRNARGKYLVFVDPDDFLEPNVYGSLVRQMEDEHLDMLRFNYQIVNENYELQQKRQFELDFDYSPHIMTGIQFLAERLDIACNIWRYIFRSEIIVKNDIWCFTGDFFDDTPWLPLVLMAAERVNCRDAVAYNYYVHSDSLLMAGDKKGIDKKTEGVFMLLECLEKELKNLQCDKKYEAGVISWYKDMEAHSIAGLFTMTAVYNFGLRHQHIARIKKMGLLPLKPKGGKIGRRFDKVKWINFSPLLFMWMVRVKNRQARKNVKFQRISSPKM